MSFFQSKVLLFFGLLAFALAAQSLEVSVAGLQSCESRQYRVGGVSSYNLDAIEGIVNWDLGKNGFTSWPDIRVHIRQESSPLDQMKRYYADFNLHSDAWIPMVAEYLRRRQIFFDSLTCR